MVFIHTSTDIFVLAFSDLDLKHSSSRSTSSMFWFPLLNLFLGDGDVLSQGRCGLTIVSYSLCSAYLLVRYDFTKRVCLSVWTVENNIPDIC